MSSEDGITVRQNPQITSATKSATSRQTTRIGKQTDIKARSLIQWLKAYFL
jgi:hypothetical protein